MPRRDFLEVGECEVYHNKDGSFEVINLNNDETRGDGWELPESDAIEMAEYILSKAGRKPIARG